MAGRNINDLLAFVTVAREGSFTRAAKLLGVTQSALSQTLCAIEARLDIRLPTRATRSVAPTAAGVLLAKAIGHRFEEIEAELDVLTALKVKPARTVRITCADQVLRDNIGPKLAPLLRHYPDIHIEFDVSCGLRDIVADRFDAGVRLGEQVHKDMVAVPMGPKIRLAAVASPDYFARHPAPKVPADLPAVSGLPSLLPEPAAAFACIRAGPGRIAAPSGEVKLQRLRARHAAGFVKWACRRTR